LVFALLATIASAQDRPSYGPEITVANAKKIAAAALAEAQKNKWNVAIAIVDNHGRCCTTSAWRTRRARAR
jgi:uncharacterized protein GlcG (DUF336 family)